MRFTWDEDKDAANKRKHGVSFETARLVFDDPFQVSRQDRVEQDRVENGEERWQTLGLIGGVTLLLVAHTWLDEKGEEHIRIISARLATANERRKYENGNTA